MNDHGQRPTGRVHFDLSLADAQALYDHTGTMPWAPGSWSNHLRAALNAAFLDKRAAELGRECCVTMECDETP